MRKRTPSEIKAYGDGYSEAYRQFCHLLERNDKDKAIRKMEIFAKAVALTVETAIDEADLVNDSQGLVEDLVKQTEEAISNLPWTESDKPLTDREMTDCDVKGASDGKFHAATPQSEDLHREKEQAYMQGYEDGRKALMERMTQQIKTGLCATCERADCEQRDEHIDKCNGYMQAERNE